MKPEPRMPTPWPTLLSGMRNSNAFGTWNWKACRSYQQSRADCTHQKRALHRMHASNTFVRICLALMQNQLCTNSPAHHSCTIVQHCEPLLFVDIHQTTRHGKHQPLSGAIRKDTHEQFDWDIEVCSQWHATVPSSMKDASKPCERMVTHQLICIKHNC